LQLLVAAYDLRERKRKRKGRAKNARRRR